VSKGYDFLGDRIRKLREINDCTQEELGNELNLPKQSISRIEKGNRKISVEELDKIADFFHTAPILILKDGLIDKKYEDSKPKNKWGIKVSQFIDEYIHEQEQYTDYLIKSGQFNFYRGVIKDLKNTIKALQLLLKECKEKTQKIL
jgi:transcriptional regulator with XRE-family HTH domain